ncbi:MAG: hypothetical protein AAGA85_02565 [Bacteroidota bacterium]
MRIFILLCFLIASLGLAAQTCSRLDAELAHLNYSIKAIPDNLASSRTAVVIYNQLEPVGDGWKTMASDMHSSLIQMAVDPVLYVNAFDQYANDQVNKRFEEVLSQRRIANLLIFVVKGAFEVEAVLVPLPRFTAKSIRGAAWKATSSALDGLLYTLGTAVKEADLRNSNFLIATKPEFLEDINLFQGDRLLNYPGAMRRQKVGLALIEEMPVQSDMNDRQKAAVTAYNLQVQEMNPRLQEVFKQFEYDWQPIVYTTDQAAMGDRIQYIVFMMSTSGEHIRRMLNYDLDKNETDYLSVTPGPSLEDTQLKKISAQDIVHKVYVRQTRSNDVFVGRDWDADDNAPDALRNFVYNWYRQVESAR